MNETAEPVIDGVPSSHHKKKKLTHKLLANSKFQVLLVIILCGLIGGSYLIIRAASTSYSLWSNNTVPAIITSSTSSSIELGVKFKSQNSGYVTAIKFYKGAQNTGTHIGSLWTAGGSLLASVTFTNETASGWQTANLAQPVNIAANVVYVASYLAPKGHYSYNSGYFTSRHAYSNGPLTALASNNINGPNGVIINSAIPAFPTIGLGNDNFWVDIVFSTKLASAPVAPAPPTTVIAAQNGNSIVVSWNAGISSNPIASYNVLRNGTKIASVNSTTLTYTDTNLTAGDTYAYQIETVDNTNAVSANSVTASVTYNVTPTTVTLSVSPTSLTVGQSATLTWSTTNATSCMATGSWSGSKAISGTASTGALSTTSTYALTCTGPGGNSNASATVTVTASGNRPVGIVQAGNSKTLCISNGSVDDITYNCLSTYTNSDPTWADWVNPWIASTSEPFVGWIAQSPTTHSLIDVQNLIPDSEASNSNWTAECAAGDYNTYATEFAQSMVAAGLGYTVIRLEAEMNGNWNVGSLGSTQAAWTQWDQCWDQEVTAMRAVPGAHFLFDWNINAYYQDFPLANIYPGNAYVDIIGIDQYDAGSSSLPASGIARWNGLVNEADGLNAVAAFATANNKPMSIPEWGTYSTAQTLGAGDDGTFVTEMAQFIDCHDVAYQSYYNANNADVLPLDPSVAPNTTAAYVAAFGPGSSDACTE